MLLDELPLTPNGKVDRKSLPEPETLRPELETPYLAPQTAAEQTIAAIWQEVLGIERVGVHDNFFEVGGTLILLVQVNSRLRESFKTNIPMVEMFRHSSISSMVKYLTGKQNGATSLHRIHEPGNQTGKRYEFEKSIQKSKTAKESDRSLVSILSLLRGKESKMKIELVGVIGAGVMGSGVAQNLAETSHRVILIDISQQILQFAKSAIQKSIQVNRMFKKSEKLENLDLIMKRIEFSTDYERLEGGRLYYRERDRKVGDQAGDLQADRQNLPGGLRVCRKYIRDPNYPDRIRDPASFESSGNSLYEPCPHENDCGGYSRLSHIRSNNRSGKDSAGTNGEKGNRR